MYELLFLGQKIKLQRKASTILEEHNSKNQ